MPVPAAGYRMAEGYEGQVASLQCNTTIKGTQDGYFNSSTEYVPFGSFVVEDSTKDPGSLTLPIAGAKLLGVAIFNDRFERQAVDSTGFPPNATIPVMTEGVVYMVAETAINRGDQVFVRHTANATPGQYDRLGRIRNDADGGNAVGIPLTEAKVLDSVQAGELVRLEIRLSL